MKDPTHGFALFVPRPPCYRDGGRDVNRARPETELASVDIVD